ncbi:MAG: glycosyltransferase, partial [Lentimicrobiaceae bacterium]|nr:glycosyltransferase [Lentimicrobiaceae bacterium]
VKLEKIDVITNISELKRFKDISKKVDLNIDLSNKKTILYAGTLGPVNDIMYVAKLAEKMIKIDPDVLFLIFGNGSEKEKIISYCQEKNILNKNIVFKEPISKDSLPHLYSKISMGSSFVWDYKIKWDNSANKFFDSLAAGRPILINYYGWQAEVINKKKCGFVLPYHYNEQDIQNLAKYLNNNENLQEQCMNALLAAEEYSLENAVSKYVNILNSICVK